MREAPDSKNIIFVNSKMEAHILQYLDTYTGGSQASGYVAKLIATKKLQRKRVKKPSLSLQAIINQQTLGPSLDDVKTVRGLQKARAERKAQLEQEGRRLLSNANSWNDLGYYNGSSSDYKKECRNAVVLVLHIQKGTCINLSPEYYKAWYPIVKSWRASRKLTPMMMKEVNSTK